MKKVFLLFIILILTIFSEKLFAIQEEQSINIEKLEQEAELKQKELLSQKDQECLILLEKQKPTLPDMFLVGILLLTAATSGYLVIKFLQSRTYLSKRKVLSLFKNKFNEMELSIEAKNEEIEILRMTVEKMKSASQNDDLSDKISFDEKENLYSSKEKILEQNISLSEPDRLIEKINTLEKEKNALEKQASHDISLIKEENLQIKQELDAAQSEKIEFLEMIESLQKQISLLERKASGNTEKVSEQDIKAIIETSKSISKEDLNSIIEPAEPEEQKPFNGIIDQDFMNQLIAESEKNKPQTTNTKEDKPRIKIEKKEISDIKESSHTVISQADLDAMFSSGSEPDSKDKLDEMFLNTPSTPISQDDLDAMFSSSKKSTVSQDDLDMLFATNSSETISQSELDTILSGKNADEQKIKKESKEESDSSLSQDQLNALLDESMTKSKETVSKPVAMSQDDLDALFNQSTTFDSPFDSSEKNENNKKEENSSGVLSQEDIEKLLGG